MIGNTECNNNYNNINGSRSGEVSNKRLTREHEFQLIVSTRGGHLLALNGFLFRLNYKRKDRTYWKCKTWGCLSTAILSDRDGLVSCRENHNHNDDQSEIHLRSSLYAIKRKSLADSGRQCDQAVRTTTNNASKPAVNNDTHISEVPSFDASFYLSGVEFDSTNYFKTELPEEIAEAAIKFEQVCFFFKFLVLVREHFSLFHNIFNVRKNYLIQENSTLVKIV